MAIPQARYVSVGSGATAADINRLTQEIRQIQATLTAHIGAGGTAHRVANETLAGFLSVADRARYEAAVEATLAGGGSSDGLDASAFGLFTGKQWGVIGGAGRDEAQNIQAAIEAIGPAGGRLVIRAENPADPVYLNSPLPIETSNLTVEFQGTLLLGPDAYVRINGGLKEILRTERGQEHTLKLRANSTTDGDGQMVLPLEVGGGAFLDLGDVVVIRGQNDKYGKAFSKQVTKIVAIVGDDAVCADEPDQTYLVTYPDSEWPSDLTTGTTISISAYSPLTVDYPGQASPTLTVANTGYFAVGDLCYINDNQTEATMIAETSGAVSTLSSACNMEIARVVAIDPVASTLTFDRHIYRPFDQAHAAGVSVMAPVTGSHIVADVVRWDAPQPSRRNSILAINYADRCSIRAAYVYGKDGRLGAAARVGYSHDCAIVDTRAIDAYRFESAEGYGLTLYYSTRCKIVACGATGNRHNYLLQTTTLAEVRDCYSGDDYISGIDVHGANAVGTIIEGCLVTRALQHSPGVTKGGAIRIGNTSHVLGDHDTRVANNTVIGYLGAEHCAFDVSPSSRNATITQNFVLDCTLALRHYKVNTGLNGQVSDYVDYSDNVMVNVPTPLDVRNYAGNSEWHCLSFNRNTFRGCGPVLVRDIPEVDWRFNVVQEPALTAGQHAFEFRDVPNLRFYGNDTGTAPRGVRVQGCGTARLVRNWLVDTWEGVAVTDGGGNTLLIDYQNDDGTPPLTLLDGGAFGDTITDGIDGGAFGDTITDGYEGGTF